MAHFREHLLDVRDLKVSFRTSGRTVEAVRGVDLEVEAGEILGIVGESGSGKSVTMKALIGMAGDSARISAQAIRFDGTDLRSLDEGKLSAIRGRQISMIFQDPMTSLDPLQRIGDHVAEVLLRHSPISRAEARQRAVSMLHKVRIPLPESRSRQYPHEFSGGMRQRVLIAMALACHPRLMIADEPTTALDVTTQAQILDLIRSLQEDEGMAVILITHDLGIAAGLCHRIAVMYGGLIMEWGDVDDIFYRPAHPYTAALLRSVPSIDRAAGTRLVPIEGSAPTMAPPPPGCPFEPRCDRSSRQCRSQVPSLNALGDRHWSRCFADTEGR